MTLDYIDWTIIATFMALTLAIGVAVAKRAGKSSAEFFLSGRGMPWWLLGMSMVGHHLLRGNSQPGGPISSARKESLETGSGGRSSSPE